MAAPAPAATAAALACWSCACCWALWAAAACGGAAARSTACANAPVDNTRHRSASRMVVSGDGVDLVELGHVEKVLLQGLHFGPHLVDDGRLQVVEVDLRAAPIELAQLAHHRLGRQVSRDVRQPLHGAGERQLEEDRLEIRRGVEGA